jgi:hypothetical protein
VEEAVEAAHQQVKPGEAVEAAVYSLAAMTLRVPLSAETSPL